MIFAGTQGYLDPLPVNKVGEFEQGLLRLLNGKNSDILDSIRTKKELTNETRDKLKAVIEAYTKSFA